MREQVRRDHTTSKKSKLQFDTLRKYLTSFLMECDQEGKPFYMHSARCIGGCEFGCNGDRGFDIAEDARGLFPAYKLVVK